MDDVLVQGLWLDDNFCKTGLEYLKRKEDKEAQKSDGGPSSPLKSFGGIDRCILRAYGKCIDLVVYLKVNPFGVGLKIWYGYGGRKKVCPLIPVHSGPENTEVQLLELVNYRC